jgi:hypothetical protein
MNRGRHILDLYVAYLRIALFGGVLGLVGALIYISVRKERQSPGSVVPTLVVTGTVVLGFVLLELPWNRVVVYLRRKRNDLFKNANERVERPAIAIGQSSNRNEPNDLSATLRDFPFPSHPGRIPNQEPPLPIEHVKLIEQLFAIRLPVR